MTPDHLCCPIVATWKKADLNPDDQLKNLSVPGGMQIDESHSSQKNTHRVSSTMSLYMAVIQVKLQRRIAASVLSELNSSSDNLEALLIQEQRVYKMRN